MLFDETSIRPATVDDAAAIAGRFYEAFGGRLVTEQQIERGGESFLEIAYGWSDLRAFQIQSSNQV
jgi:hypothetical protein